MLKMFKFSRIKSRFIIVLVSSILLFSIALILFPNSKFLDSDYYVRNVKRIYFRETASLEADDYIDITIDTTAQKKLDKYVLKRPVKKKWVTIKIRINDKYFPAKIKYHGTDESNYRDKVYSYSLKLSRDSPYIKNGRRFLLIKGSEAVNIIPANFMGNKAGLISAVGRFVILRINNKEIGKYYFVENIKKELLERDFGITNYCSISHTSDWTRKERKGHTSLLDFFTGHLELEKNPNFGIALKNYKEFANHIEQKNFESVINYIDKEYMASYLANLYIFNSTHDITGDNLKFIFDFSIGKFYPIYRAELKGFEIDPKVTIIPKNYNSYLFEKLHTNYKTSKMNLFFKILISDDEIRNLRDEKLYSYYKNEDAILKSVDSLSDKNMNIHNFDNQYINQNSGIYFVKSLISKSLKNFGEYISTGHIYASLDTLNNSMSIAFDAFAPIKVVNKNTQKEIGVYTGIKIDSDLTVKNIISEIPISEFSSNIKKDLIFLNCVTGDTIKKKRIYVNFIKEEKNTSLSMSEGLTMFDISHEINDDTLLINKGVYKILHNFSISKVHTVIEPGTKFLLAEGVDIRINGGVSIKGVKSDSVYFSNLHPKEVFGSIKIVGDGESQTSINYLSVKGGSTSFSDGLSSSGQFSIYKSNVDIRNSSFSQSRGDDGLNLKFCKSLIDSCRFVNNFADQLDIDFCISKISNCMFFPQLVDANGDGLDFSGSFVQVENCNFANFVDKGMSVGEHSTVIVTNNYFSNNSNAIAAKDQSSLYCWNNNFSGNEIDIISYIKKPIFNLPILYLEDSNLKSYNMKLIEADVKNLNIDLKNNIKAKFVKYYTSNKKLSYILKEYNN